MKRLFLLHLSSPRRARRPQRRWLWIAAALLLLPPAAWSAPGWGVPRELTRADGAMGEVVEQPSVLVALQNVYVAYKRGGIYLMRSDNYGKTWNGPYAISEELALNEISILEDQSTRLYGTDFAPALLRSRDSLEAIWSHYNGKTYELRHSMSSDNGNTWEEPTVLHRTDDHAFTPRIVTLNQRHFVVWYEIQLVGAGFRGIKSINPSLMIREGATGPLNADDINFDVELRDRLSSDQFNYNIRIAEILPRARALRAPIERIKSEKPWLPRVFSAFSDGGNRIIIAWNEGREYRSIRTDDFGKTYQPIGLTDNLPPNMLASFAQGAGGLQVVEIPYRPFQLVSLTHRRLVGDAKPVLLADQFYSMEPPKMALAGNDAHIVYAVRQDKSSAIYYLRTDRTPPVARFLEPYSEDILTPTMTVRWTGEDDYSLTENLEYRFHNLAEWLPYSRETEVALRTMPDGRYEIKLQARDEAGNQQEEPTVFRFNTSRVAPDSFLVGEPPTMVKSRQLALRWSGTDNSTPVEQLEYRYRLDGGPWSEFSTATEKTLTGLSEGRHVFEVQARDDKGNIEEVPLRVEFEVRLNIAVDFVTTPPSLLNTREVVLEWAATDETGASDTPYLYSYRVNYGSWSQESIDNRLTLTLPEGHQVVEIRARDESGNQSVANLKYEVTIDVTPPETDPIPLPRAYTSQNHPRIALGGKDNLTQSERLQFVWRKNDGPWALSESNKELQVPEPIQWYSLGYVVQVAARDEAGNEDPTPAEISYLIMDRNPNMVYILAAVAGLVVLAILYAAVASVKRARDRARRRRKAAERDKEFDLSTAAAGVAASTPSPTTTVAGADSTAPAPTTEQTPLADPFAAGIDPFATATDPFASNTDPFASDALQDPFAAPSEDDKEKPKDPFAS